MNELNESQDNNSSKNDTITGSNQDEKTEEILYDKIISDYGFGIETWKIIICVTLIYFLSGFLSTVFSSMVNSYKDMFKLTDNQIGTIGSLFFISKALGSFCAGYFTSLMRRNTISNFIYISLTILSFSEGIFDPFPYFIILRIVTGYLCGILEIIGNNLLCEYLPIHNRSLVLNSVWVSYSLSQITTYLIMLMTMPNMQTDGIKKTFIIISPIFIVFFLLNVTLLNDSPRNLILLGIEEDAIEILSKYKPVEFFTAKNKRTIIRQIKRGVNRDDQNQHYIEVFKHPYLKFTLITCYINLIANLLNDGSTLITNIILKDINIESNKSPYKEIIMSNLYIQFTNIIFYFSYGFISEIKALGRIKTIFIGLILICLSCIPCILFPKNITVFMAIFSALLNVQNLVLTYSSEVFPTKFRDAGLGIVQAFSFVGSSLSQFLMMFLVDINWRVPFYAMMVFSLSCSIVICFSPVETYERPLDIKINNNGKDIKSLDEENEKLI